MDKQQIKIDPARNYRRLDNGHILTGQQILNLLSLSNLAMQAVVLLGLTPTDEPVNRGGKYGTEELAETDEVKLTFTEYRALSDFVTLCRDMRELEAAIRRLTPDNRLLVASAVSRLGEALDKAMPGWRGESDET